MPFVLILAGPNGSGKTTFAQRLLPRLGQVCFINADVVARSFPPEITGPARDLQAGRATIKALDDAITAGKDIALETTLATLRYQRLIPTWRARGYEVDLYYLRLVSADLAVERVRRRVASGGHDIPEEAIRRRFGRSLENFETYRSLVNTWYLYDSNEGGHEFALMGENHG